MNFTYQIEIEAGMKPFADNKAAAVQKVVNVLDQASLDFLAEICQSKGNAINGFLVEYQSIIRENIN